ncbi:protein FAM187B-like [Octodon degus]|uniref:Protein FAM187B-like n=1 Tax=Octodon degus TaxID=10160 RepID=A0A6P3FFX2_OCTDE|nr:protein FAM187B-like [Octodon degus]
MLPMLWLLLSLAVPVLGFYTPVSCPQGHKCQLALLSGNDVLLECPVHGAQWKYYFSVIKKSQAFNPSKAPNIEVTLRGHLSITRPLPSQTGNYYCWEKNSTQVTQYEIDFQDVNSLHITHMGLDQMPLQNESLRAGGQEIMFTLWEPWQDCNRCGAPGERKRLGYCYVIEPLEDPIPCGLYLGESLAWLPRQKPEVQFEACFVECNDMSFALVSFVIFDSFSFNEEQESLWLSCPLASIYRPVSWEADNISLTWQNQLSGKHFNSTLDISTGGKQLQIFQPATYRCFVEQEFVAQFNPMESLELMEPLMRENKSEAPARKLHSVPLMLKLLLLIGTALSLGLLLFNTLCPLSGKSRSLLLVK